MNRYPDLPQAPEAIEERKRSIIQLIANGVARNQTRACMSLGINPLNTQLTNLSSRSSSPATPVKRLTIRSFFNPYFYRKTIWTESIVAYAACLPLFL